MKTLNLKPLINETLLKNNQNDERFNTNDLVFLDSVEEIAPNDEVWAGYDELNVKSSFKSLKGERNKQITSATDWAIINGAFVNRNIVTSTGKKGATWYHLRSYKKAVSPDAQYLSRSDHSRYITLCPSLHLNISAVIAAHKKLPQLLKTDVITDKKGNTLYHTIEFGEYPKNFVGKKLNAHLEKQLKKSNESLKPTGKKYTGNIAKDCNIIYSEEYEYHGQRFVRVMNCNDNVRTADNTKLSNGEWSWLTVEPIVWKIRNWDELPKEINPEGSGKAEYIDVRTEEAIACLPFHQEAFAKNCELWQNSTIRGYLNGINVNNIETNGNTKFTAQNGGDFSEHNFLNEAMELDLQNVLSNQEEENEEDAYVLTM